MDCIFIRFTLQIASETEGEETRENKKQRVATYSSNQNKTKQNKLKEKIERGTFYCGIKFGLHVLQLSSKLFANDFTVIFQMGEFKISK